MTRPGKRMRQAQEGLDKESPLPLREALEAIKSRGKTKFDEGVDMACNLGIDPRHADQMVRGMCDLPHGVGRDVRVAVFAREPLAQEARDAGAVKVGAEDLVKEVESGALDFDRAIAAPDMMVLVGKLGRVLGPRGLMPNPRSGTVTKDIAAAVRAARGGRIEFRAEKAGIVHSSVGRISFSLDALEENARAFIDALTRAKPSGAKGTYLQRAWVSSTMGPSARIDTASLTNPT